MSSCSNQLFYAELSDANGDFTNATQLLPWGVSPLTVTIPVNTPGGSAYRIRVATNSPPQWGMADNGADITITPTTSWYLDADNDNYYVGNAVNACTSPGAGYKNTGLLGVDCNDGNASLTTVCPNQFITKWNLTYSGSGATQISFGVGTTGTVDYMWEEVSPGTATGSGTFSGSTATITGLPSGSVIRLIIQPTNFNRININNGTDRNRLVDVEQWGSAVEQYASSFLWLF
ncbi:MAG: hypothetical protein IPH78_12230 [Bacteroidetes bacterium]|nr:hypothetical protein [Bacteroidota bacterium]